jgi:hypothetical protein
VRQRLEICGVAGTTGGQVVFAFQVFLCCSIDGRQKRHRVVLAKKSTNEKRKEKRKGKKGGRE